MRRGFQVLVSGIVLAGLTLAGAGVASAQEPAKEPAKPVLTLEGEAAIVILLIKPDKTADFEAVVAKYREALDLVARFASSGLGAGAVRALSPGINDPTTAQDAIFHLGTVLVHRLSAPPIPVASASRSRPSR